MSRFLIIASFLVLSVTPFSAHAEWKTVLNLTGEAPQGQWGGSNAVLTATPDGLRIQAQAGGASLLKVTATHPIDAVRITFANSPRTPSTLLWHRLKDPPNSLFELAIPLGAGGPDEIVLPVANFDTWDRYTDVLGLGFPQGGDTTVSQIEFIGWSFSEKIWSGVRSFFVKDNITAYSINFLWGPLIVTDSLAIKELYQQQPPFGISVNRFLYALILLAAAALFVWALWSRKTLGIARGQKAIIIFFLVLGFLWIAYDARMGGEAIANFLQDLRTYTFAEPGKKQFRNQQNFNDAVERSLPVLTSVDRFAVLVPDGVPIVKYVLYQAYPKGVPLEAGRPLSEADAILVFRREDISVDAAGRLLRATSGDPEVLSASGSILEQFDPISFLYRKDQ